MKKTNIWKRMSGWLRAFLILALVFLALGLGTLGSIASVGDGYVLSSKKESDGKEPAIVLKVSIPDVKAAKYVDENGEEKTRDLYVKEIYFNIGAAYTEAGENFTLTVAHSSSTGSNSFYNSVKVSFANFYEQTEEGKTGTAVQDALCNWVRYDVTSPTDGWRVNAYRYYKITTDTNVLINEIVLVGNDQDLSAEGEHTPVALQAEVYYNKETGEGSVLPYDSSRGESIDTAVRKASAIVDSSHIPNLAQSSFFRLGQEEICSMMTVAEMRQGRNYAQNSVYHLDTVYNFLGNALLALGTRIGGMSPFGLRLMPFLASFGVLVFGFLFVRKLTGSEKAGFVFSVLYALCGVSMSLGHFGVPVMIGLFFFTASLYFTTRFFMDGMKKPTVASAVPALLGGLFAAAAICVNGAFVIPVAGIVGLFIAGLVRQYRKTRAALNDAIDETEAAEKNGVAEGESSEERKKLAAALTAHRMNGLLSGFLFFSFLILGAFLIAMIASLPMYYTYVKLYDNPEDPSKSIFYFLWKAFAGGFAGGNYMPAPQSPWSLFYLLFKGTGESFAVTAAGPIIAVAALLAGIAGAAVCIIMLARKVNDDSFKPALVPVLVPLVGVVLGLVTAAFAQGALAFQLIAYVCLFALAARAASFEEEGTFGKVVKGLSLACLFALAVCFGLFAVFTFSIPTSGFLAGLWA